VTHVGHFNPKSGCTQKGRDDEAGLAATFDFFLKMKSLVYFMC